MSRSNTSRPRKRTTGGTGNKKLGAVATLVPLAISMIPAALSLRQPPGQPSEQPAAAQPATAQPARKATPRKFLIPISDLQEWAESVLVTLDDVTIKGNSDVHGVVADCELHFGGHSPSFQGKPPGLVLEPMNVCSLPFPGKTVQKSADWIEFANRIKNTVVTVSGVPRIWPEHLKGSKDVSNPDHAVEFHPLTSVISNGQTFDFAPNVSAGKYEGGVSLPIAQSIVKQTTVNVTRVGGDADIRFGGRVGNFTVLEINVEKASITPDSAGSFRMNGEVVLDDGTAVAVRIVTIKGSPINDEIARIRSSAGLETAHLGEMLVLFSLSPEMLLDAANKSNGDPVDVPSPIQLILYGPPDA